MNSQNSIVLLLVGALVMVVAVFAALRLVGDSSSDVPETAMTKSDVEKIVKNYLLENPEVIFEAVDRMQAKQGDQRVAQMRGKAKSLKSEIFNEPDPIIAGNPKGDVTIVEFFDYRCPYCKKVKKDVADLLKQDGNIRLVLKEFPILSAESEMAAQAAIASVAQGKYWDFHMAMMGAEDLSKDAIFAIAKKTGIDVERLKADMKDPRVEKRLASTQELARKLGIDATPTFFIGDEPHIGGQSLSELKEAVAAARKARPS